MLRLQDFQGFCKTLVAVQRSARAAALFILLTNLCSAISVDDLQKLPWEHVAVAALALALVIVAAVFALSKLFAVDELESWAKNEIWQVVGMAILIFIVWNIDKIEKAAFAVAGKIKDPIEFGKEYLMKVRRFVSLRLGELSLFGFAFGTFLGPLEKIELVILQPGDYIGEYGSIIKSQIIGVLFSALGGAAAITVAQTYLLQFIKAFALPFVLPVGIVLRSVPLCRGIGSALIAIALGLYFVYPLTLILNARMIEHFRGAYWDSVEIIPGWIRDFLGMTAPGAAPATTWAAQVGLFRLVRGFFRNPIAVSAIAIGMTYHTINLLYEHTAFAIVILGAVLPFISIVITFGITRELAALLGVDLELSTLLRIL